MLNSESKSESKFFYMGVKTEGASVQRKTIEANQVPLYFSCGFIVGEKSSKFDRYYIPGKLVNTMYLGPLSVDCLCEKVMEKPLEEEPSKRDLETKAKLIAYTEKKGKNSGCLLFIKSQKDMYSFLNSNDCTYYTYALKLNNSLNKPQTEQPQAPKPQVAPKPLEIKQAPDNKVELEKKDKELAEKNKQIAEKDKELEKKDRELADKDKELADKDKELAEKNKRIADKDKELAEKNKQIADKDKELAEKNKQIAEKDKELAELKEKLDKANDAISEKETDLFNRDNEIDTLKAEVETMSEQNNSYKASEENLRQELESLKAQYKELETKYNEDKGKIARENFKKHYVGRGKHPVIAKKEGATILNLRSQGLSIETIASYLNHSPTTIRKIIKELGDTKPRRRGGAEQ